MFKKFFKIFDLIFTPTILLTPEAATNLRRAKSNVKVVWEPSVTVGVVSQRIIVMSHNNKLIEKDLAPETAAFSFSAMRDSEIQVSIFPFNGKEYGEGVSLNLKV